ncbi:hypothetical protein [Vibrio parahaemolyticus]|uniref:hypothetical protein n=1 Tax=Vibrio parahaemolyticus TaxID=670 RepID=UPI002554EB26|nr:hypothetical protein [Vibrio parahaemolyticus]
MNIQKQHVLLAAVGELSTITLKALTYAEDQTLTAEATKDGALDAAALSWLRIEKISGLTSAQIDEMVTPDINVIKHFAVLTIASDARQVAKELALSYPEQKESLVIPLLQPLVDGTQSYKLRYPNGRLTKMLELETNDDRRTFMLCEFCTGLSEQQLKSMSTPDWNTLQAVLDNFLGKTAEFFRP